MSTFIFGFEAALYAVLTIIISTIVTTYLEKGLSRKQMVYIISDNHEEIKTLINNELKRGATILHGEGTYTNNSKEVIMVIVNFAELRILKKNIYKIDPQAFTVVQTVNSTFGEGFDSYIIK